MKTGIADSVKINDKYAQILSTFDVDLQSAVDDALQKYLIEQIRIKIVTLKQKVSVFKKKYGCDYETFHKKISEDEAYVNQVECNIDKMWETDLFEWELCHKGIKDWTDQLQNVLIML